MNREFISILTATPPPMQATPAPAYGHEWKRTVLRISASTVPSACFSRVRIGISCQLALKQENKSNSSLFRAKLYFFVVRRDGGRWLVRHLGNSSSDADQMIFFTSSFFVVVVFLSPNRVVIRINMHEEATRTPAWPLGVGIEV
jgi:hypothetical protein